MAFCPCRCLPPLGGGHLPFSPFAILSHIGVVCVSDSVHSPSLQAVNSPWQEVNPKGPQKSQSSAHGSSKCPVDYWWETPGALLQVDQSHAGHWQHLAARAPGNHGEGRAKAAGRNFHLSILARPASALCQQGAQCLRNVLPNILVFKGDSESLAS